MSRREKKPHAGRWNSINEPQRAALMVHLDAVLFAWATVSESPLEDDLSDYIDLLAARLGLSESEKDRFIDAACERAARLCPIFMVQEALAEIEDAS